jgi:signal transduction histidine kinase
MGVLYLEHDSAPDAFTPEVREALERFLEQAALCLENARRRDALEQRVALQARELAEARELLRRTQGQLAAQEKLAALGLLTSGIAHDIKNSLNFINNFAALSVELVDELREELTPQRARPAAGDAAPLESLVDDLRHNTAKIVEHGKRVDGIVKGMLEHARHGPRVPREVDLNALVSEHVNLAYQAFRLQEGTFHAQLEFHLDAGLAPLAVEEQELGRVVQNLASNACYALHARRGQLGEAFTPVLRVSTRDCGDRVELRLRDNGGGIPRASQDQLFVPFYTTKPAGQGTGLGLPLSRDLVRAHGGTLTFESEEGAFTEFLVVLPRKQRALA